MGDRVPNPLQPQIYTPDSQMKHRTPRSLAATNLYARLTDETLQ